MSTIFEKIIAREIPAHIVHEDEHTIAFLDINPLSRGHVLLVPKESAPTMDKLSDESAAALGRVLPKLCRAVASATGCPDYNLLQNNGEPAHQAVHHVHIHIIPKPAADKGLGISWPLYSLGDETAADLVKKITAALA